MAPVRRTAAPVAAAVEYELFDAGDLAAYSGGKTIPEGDYALELVVQMNQSTNAAGQAVGKPRVGVQMFAHPLAGGDPIEQFVSFGSKAHESWAPHPDTGKSLVKIPVSAGGKGLPPPKGTNWQLLLESLYQAGLPAGYFKNDFTLLDGIWVHIKPMPEPENRKDMKKNAATGEQGQEEDSGPRGSGMVPTVTAILDGGRVWIEGEGGFDFASAPAPVAAPPAWRGSPGSGPATPAPVAAPRRAVAPTAAPVVAAAEVEGDSEELIDIVNNAIGDVLTLPEFIKTAPKRLKFRLKVHEMVKAKYDDKTASDVISTYFGSDDSLSAVLSPIGYKISGAGPQADIVPDSVSA